MSRLLVILAVLLALTPVTTSLAVEPEEMLSDPTLEARARISRAGMRTWRPTRTSRAPRRR